MEIERKYIITKKPELLSSYPCKSLCQAYLNTEPVIRIRKEDDTYVLTYKSKGLMVREEYNLPLDKASFEHLLKKADGRIITKDRFLIPYQTYTIELDVFKGDLAPLLLAEVEFPNTEEANQFSPPDWFGEEVTLNPKFQNSYLSKK
ncbi:CYTH domain-containing protein [Aequitasia blattaphilus]|uniref:CYTH domain-containing protein n=1 Tax=Aequitasia blattaphilus TaxID=2949332 RepID=A0ABT1E991_9FIRM|nr:CYTH domain-containing protein [Aequitasia blattaphilus]MCP1101436.1 CYTH domain-containing protein [Aequitasia blattaphilus]MCR8614076.1 CYTH domain-containing protein [Aequitasia blattaphilus]